MRPDQRDADQLRPLKIIPNHADFPADSVLIVMGQTRVLCSATVEDGVPRWMLDQNISGGWVTGEYILLEHPKNKPTSRQTGGLPNGVQEIRHWIGRSLRAALNLSLLGERTVIVGCDVMQADGGSRTAAITGGYVAMVIALRKLIRAGVIPAGVLRTPVAAVSVGVVNGEVVLDLTNDEDRMAEVDINVVMNQEGQFTEVQGSAEFQPISRATLEKLLNLASQGIHELLEAQQAALLGV